MAGQEEHELIRRAADGDRRAQQQLLESIYDFVRQFLFRLVGAGADVDDLQHVVLLKVLEHLSRFHFKSSFRTWVGGICVHAAHDLLRRKKVAAAHSELPVEHSSRADAVEQRLEARRTLTQFERALSVLSVEQRTALLLKTVDGYSVEEVAVMMKSAVSTTRMRLYFARKRVAAEMARLGSGEGGSVE